MKHEFAIIIKIYYKIYAKIFLRYYFLNLNYVIMKTIDFLKHLPISFCLPIDQRNEGEEQDGNEALLLFYTRKEKRKKKFTLVKRKFL